MVKKRWRHTAIYKFRVALEALEGSKWSHFGSTLIAKNRSEILSLLQIVPPTGFEPVLPAPEADALSTELRGHDAWRTIPQRLFLEQTTFLIRRSARQRAGRLESLCSRVCR